MQFCAKFQWFFRLFATIRGRLESNLVPALLTYTSPTFRIAPLPLGTLKTLWYLVHQGLKISIHWRQNTTFRVIQVINSINQCCFNYRYYHKEKFATRQHTLCFGKKWFFHLILGNKYLNNRTIVYFYVKYISNVILSSSSVP